MRNQDELQLRQFGKSEQDKGGRVKLFKYSHSGKLDMRQVHDLFNNDEHAHASVLLVTSDKVSHRKWFDKEKNPATVKLWETLKGRSKGRIRLIVCAIGPSAEAIFREVKMDKESFGDFLSKAEDLTEWHGFKPGLRVNEKDLEVQSVSLHEGPTQTRASCPWGSILGFVGWMFFLLLLIWDLYRWSEKQGEKKGILAKNQAILAKQILTEKQRKAATRTASEKRLGKEEERLAQENQALVERRELLRSQNKTFAAATAKEKDELGAEKEKLDKEKQDVASQLNAAAKVRYQLRREKEEIRAEQQDVASQLKSASQVSEELRREKEEDKEKQKRRENREKADKGRSWCCLL